MVFDVSPQRFRQVAHGKGVDSTTINMGASLVVGVVEVAVVEVVSFADVTPGLETFSVPDVVVSCAAVVTSSRDGVTAGASLGQNNSTAEAR